MIVVLTAIALFVGLTLFALIAALTLRALLNRPHRGEGRSGGVIEGIAAVAEIVSHADFDIPDIS